MTFHTDSLTALVDDLILRGSFLVEVFQPPRVRLFVLLSVMFVIEQFLWKVVGVSAGIVRRPREVIPGAGGHILGTLV